MSANFLSIVFILKDFSQSLFCIQDFFISKSTHHPTNKKPHECVCRNLSFCPSNLKRTEGHYTGRISLNSCVDLPTHLYKSIHCLRAVFFEHYLLKPNPYQNFIKININQHYNNTLRLQYFLFYLLNLPTYALCHQCHDVCDCLYVHVFVL